MKSLGIDQLTVAERLALVEEIWASIAVGADESGVPPSHQAELERRLADDAANPEAGQPWVDVKARLFGKP